MTISWSDSGQDKFPNLSLDDACSLAIQGGFVFASAPADAMPRKKANMGGVMVYSTFG